MTLYVCKLFIEQKKRNKAPLTNLETLVKRRTYPFTGSLPSNFDVSILSLKLTVPTTISMKDAPSAIYQKLGNFSKHDIFM